MKRERSPKESSGDRAQAHHPEKPGEGRDDISRETGKEVVPPKT